MAHIAGIDLGTTFSAISILNQMGRPEIVPNADGDRTTPSAVYFPLELEKDEQVSVGVEAIHSRHENSERCIRWIKQEMGDTHYAVNIDGQEWSPAQISSLILKKLKDDASVALGEEVVDAVITVPANFGETARKATMDAGKLAGLNVLGLINEPTAAAIYYSVVHDNISGTILIFDLGGGTFDVSVAQVNGRDIEILCSLGDRHLGGRNFDEELVTHFSDLYRIEKDADLFSSEEDRAEVEDYLEEIKKSLSRRPSANVRLRGEAGELRTEISREKFEELIGPYLCKMEMLVENVFDELKMRPCDADAVILVGGSSRIPAVQAMLARIFGFPPTLVGNLDECVSLGAAVYAGIRMIQDRPVDVSQGIQAGLSHIQLTDVCNHSYGTTALQKDELTGKPEVKNIILIPKNTPVPCQISQVFLTTSANQTSVTADVTQGEGSDIGHVEHLAQDVLELPPGRPAGQRIKITYSYDVNERMQCVFEDEASGRKKIIKIDMKAKADGTGGKVDVEERTSALQSLITE
jgi:molecular chaperone DnaK